MYVHAYKISGKVSMSHHRQALPAKDLNVHNSAFNNCVIIAFVVLVTFFIDLIYLCVKVKLLHSL